MILNIPLPGSPLPFINSDGGLITSDGSGTLTCQELISNTIVAGALIQPGPGAQVGDLSSSQLLYTTGQPSIDWENGIIADDTGLTMFTWTAGSLHAVTQLRCDQGIVISTKDIITDTVTGTKIAQATGQKIAFHGSTPVIQRAGATQAAVAVTGSTNVVPFGYTTAAQADAIVTLVNEIRAALVQKGIIKGAA